jgi:hypothetical protein
LILGLVLLNRQCDVFGVVAIWNDARVHPDASNPLATSSVKSISVAPASEI